MWDARYSTEDYMFGTEPNAFLVEVSSRIPKGRVLCLAEGEGRNGVHLASQGFDVTGIDSSRVGLEKAKRLAAQRSVHINTIVADLAEYPFGTHAWKGIVSIFCHLPPEIRRGIHRKVVDGLCPGGAFVLEAYTPRQLEFRTGGPSHVELLADAETLRQELAGLRFERCVEVERDIVEGIGHHGHSAVVQIVAFKPDTL